MAMNVADATTYVAGPEIDPLVRLIPVEALRPGDSPRRSGIDPEHVRLLAEAETDLPPILVHRATYRVIDGAHRLSAAKLRGDGEIEARFFDGSEQDAFVLSVRANVTHGLPLPRADRESAAVRIAVEHPFWSDRAIAAACGLAAATVKRLRKASAPSDLDARIGRDGRTRPLDSAEGRRRVTEAIAARTPRCGNWPGWPACHRRPRGTCGSASSAARPPSCPPAAPGRPTPTRT